MSLRLEDVIGIFTDGVSSRIVVADGEREGRSGIHVAQLIAHDGGTSDLRGALPDDLAEVTPAIEELHEGTGEAVQSTEEAHLIVVHQVGDHLADVVLIDTVPDVLTIATTVNAPMRC